MEQTTLIILAIDPGPAKSGWCVYEHAEPCGTVHDAGTDTPNAELLKDVPSLSMASDELVIEQVASYGMPVGADVFDTVFWSGRFAQAWSGAFHRLPFLAVKMQLCHDSRAKESNVRQAVRDLFPGTGGGLRPEIGIKAQPGPLYRVKGHAWSALALAVAFGQKHDSG